MKYRFLIYCLLTFIISSAVTAQEIGIGYAGHFVYQPGFKVTYSQQIGNFYGNGNITYFSRIGDNRNWLFNVEAGKKFQKESKRRYMNLGMSLGYWRQVEIVGFSIDLSTGNTLSEDLSIRNYFIPAVVYEQGWQYGQYVPYLKNTLGVRSGNSQGSFSYFFEVGVKYTLGKNE